MKRLESLLEHSLGMLLCCAQLKVGHAIGLDHYHFVHTLSMNIAEFLEHICRKENAIELPYYGHGKELEHSAIAVQQIFDLCF